MHFPLTWVSIIIAGGVSGSLVEGGPAQRQRPSTALDEDETSLLQAAASTTASQAKAAATEARKPVCVEEEVQLDSIVKPSATLLAAPSSSEPKRHTAEAMRWFPDDSKQSLAPAALTKAAPDEADETPRRTELHEAALAADDVRCESLLLRAAEPLAAADAWGTTALHAAASSGAHVVAELFLEHGTPVDPTDAWDETPLHLAAREGHVKVCELLAKRGASLRALNAENSTALVVAAHAGQEAVCRSLLAFGAGVEGLSEEELPEMLLELIVEMAVKTSSVTSSWV